MRIRWIVRAVAAAGVLVYCAVQYCDRPRFAEVYTPLWGWSVHTGTTRGLEATEYIGTVYLDFDQRVILVVPLWAWEPKQPATGPFLELRSIEPEGRHTVVEWRRDCAIYVSSGGQVSYRSISPSVFAQDGRSTEFWKGIASIEADAPWLRDPSSTQPAPVSTREANDPPAREVSPATPPPVP